MFSNFRMLSVGQPEKMNMPEETGANKSFQIFDAMDQQILQEVRVDILGTKPWF